MSAAVGVSDGSGEIRTEQTVLWIGGFYSQCGACGRNADPYEASHEMKTMRGDGCGATYTHVASSTMGIGAKHLTEMRPDLQLRDAAGDPR